MADRNYQTLPPNFDKSKVQAKNFDSSTSKKFRPKSHVKSKSKKVSRLHTIVDHHDLTPKTLKSNHQTTSAKKGIFSGFFSNGFSNFLDSIRGGVKNLLISDTENGDGDLTQNNVTSEGQHLGSELSDRRRSEAVNRLQPIKTDEYSDDVDEYFDASSTLKSSLTKITAHRKESYELRSISSSPSVSSSSDSDVTSSHTLVPCTFQTLSYCDICSQSILNIYDTGSLTCTECHLTCHVACIERMTLRCTHSNRGSSGEDRSNIDTTTHSASTYFNTMTSNWNDTLKDVDHINLNDQFGNLSLTDPVLRFGFSIHNSIEKCVTSYNENFNVDHRTKSDQQSFETLLSMDKTSASGYVRVHFNLRRPINVVSGTRPPSTYNITTLSLDEEPSPSQQLSPFYLPRETARVLHVTTETTSKTLIYNLLAKFRIVDSPHKFALYEKQRVESVDQNSSPTNHLKKLSDDVRPLILALVRVRQVLERVEMSQVSSSSSGDFESIHQGFVLQENEPGEIVWDEFSVPELRRFLMMLGREEAIHKKRLHDTHAKVQEVIQKRLKDVNILNENQ